jgi:hypothetical protein
MDLISIGVQKEEYSAAFILVKYYFGAVEVEVRKNQ